MRISVLLAVVVATLGLASPAVASTVNSGPASRLVLERTGGFAGVRETFVVDRGTAGGSRVLALAGTARFRRLGPSYQPANPCCDRSFYRLTAYYPAHHGTTKTITTVEGTPAPSVLREVITLTQQIGTHH